MPPAPLCVLEVAGLPVNINLWGGGGAGGEAAGITNNPLLTEVRDALRDVWQNEEWLAEAQEDLLNAETPMERNFLQWDVERLQQARDMAQQVLHYLMLAAGEAP